MLYAILCYDSEAVVGAWSKEEDAAAIAKHFMAHDITCGPETLRFGAEGKGPSIYLQDLEGNGIELKGPAASGSSPE